MLVKHFELVDVNNLKINLTDVRFGRLIAKYPIRNTDRSRIYWHCICDCGNECDVETRVLNQGATNSCGCLVKDGQQRKGSSVIAINTIYNGYRSKATYKGIRFELSKEEFVKFIKSNCYYCGSLPNNTFSTYRGNQKHIPFKYSGIDRIDSNKGYTVDNCVPCCAICNIAKNDLALEQFRQWINRIYKYQFKRFSEKTPAILMDELFTVNTKLWFEQEKLLASPKGSGEADEHAKKAQELNAKRNRLMRGLDEILDFEEYTVTEKSYDK